MATRSASYVLGLIAFGAFSAAADPLVDDLAAMRENWSCGTNETEAECLVAYQHEMASNQGFQEAALKLCPHLVVTNQPLRDLRNRKYAGTAAFKEGYQYVTLGYPSRGEQGREILCLSAVSGDSWLAKK